MSGSISNNDSHHHRRVFLVTGANNGIGLETTRQLIQNEKNMVYMLCRSSERAKAAIARLGNPTNVEFVEFDAYNYKSCAADNNDDGDSLKEVPVIVPEDVIDGVLLNAGGFGETLEPSSSSSSKEKCSKLAKLNLMGHVALVKDLIKQQKLRKGSRIVASGSEACFTVPTQEWHKADFQKHLEGTAVNKYVSYSWVKGIVALYWSAFARRHPDLYVTTVSPGCVKDGTGFYTQKGVPGIVNFGAKIAILINGSHSVEQGAKRYLDSLNWEEEGTEKDCIPKSGAFLAHRKGYTKDFGDVTEDPRGVPFGDTQLQDLVWDAVEDLLDDANKN